MPRGDDRNASDTFRHRAASRSSLIVLLRLAHAARRYLARCRDLYSSSAARSSTQAAVRPASVTIAASSSEIDGCGAYSNRI